MSVQNGGIVSAKRREAAKKHADYSYTCSCGKTVRGNGGRSSHRRACKSRAPHERTDVSPNPYDLSEATHSFSGKKNPVEP